MRSRGKPRITRITRIGFAAKQRSAVHAAGDADVTRFPLFLYLPLFVQFVSFVVLPCPCFLTASFLLGGQMNGREIVQALHDGRPVFSSAILSTSPLWPAIVKQV